MVRVWEDPLRHGEVRVLLYWFVSSNSFYMNSVRKEHRRREKRTEGRRGWIKGLLTKIKRADQMGELGDATVS